MTEPTDPPPAARPRRRPGPGLPAAVGWVVLLIVGQTAVVFVAVVAWAATLTVLRQPVGQPNPALLLAVGTVGTLLTAVPVVGLMFGRSARLRLALRLPAGIHVGLVLLLAVPMIAVMSEASAWIADILRLIGVPEPWIQMDHLTAVIDAVREYPAWPMAAAVVVFGGLSPGVGEELYFRGFVGRGLVARWGLVRGVLLTSLLFGAMHVHPLHALGAALIGVVLHAVYFWTRSLVAPMVLHAWYNCLALLVSVLSRDTPMDLTADEHVPPALAATALAAMVGVMVLLYQSRVWWVRADGTECSPGYPTAEIPPAKFGARVEGRRPGVGAALAAAGAYLAFVAVLVWELAR